MRSALRGTAQNARPERHAAAIDGVYGQGVGSERRRPTEEDRLEATRVALSGIAAGEVDDLAWRLDALHPKDNTFPGEVLLELAADAIEDAGASRERPIEFENIRTRYLPEDRAHTKAQHRKAEFAIRAAAMIRAGDGRPLPRSCRRVDVSRVRVRSRSPVAGRAITSTSSRKPARSRTNPTRRRCNATTTSRSGTCSRPAEPSRSPSTNSTVGGPENTTSAWRSRSTSVLDNGLLRCRLGTEGVVSTTARRAVITRRRLAITHACVRQRCTVLERHIGATPRIGKHPASVSDTVCRRSVSERQHRQGVIR